MKFRTSNDHHADGEYLLVISFGRNVSKPHGSHTGHGEVQSCDIHRPTGWSSDKFWRSAGIGPQVAVRRLSNIGQFPQPRILYTGIRVRPSYRIPSTEMVSVHKRLLTLCVPKAKKVVSSLWPQMND